MSDLLGLAPSTYSRIERNEGSVNLEQILDFSQKLNIPVQDFLPETISINNHNQDENSHIGLVIGNINHYSDKETALENSHLKEKNVLLEKRIVDLEEAMAMLKGKPP